MGITLYCLRSVGVVRILRRSDRARQMAESIECEQINCIIDIHAGSPFPPNALLHFRRMPSSAYPKFKFGTVVIIGDNPFVKTLMDIMRHLNRQAMENFHFAKTVQEARYFEKSARECVVLGLV